MSVFKYHAFIYFLRPPPWYGTHIKMKSQIRTRIKVKSMIRIPIKIVWIHNFAKYCKLTAHPLTVHIYLDISTDVVCVEPWPDIFRSSRSSLLAGVQVGRAPHKEIAPWDFPSLEFFIKHFLSTVIQNQESFCLRNQNLLIETFSQV
jgi:hypothetical protein